ncbi:MAG: response regulator transcription factor [Burkholderiales bacterium]
MISILLADDHPLVLRGLHDLFEAQEGFSVVGQETDALRIFESVKRLRPDVLVLDLMMPGLNGMEIILQVTRQCPDTRVVVLSMHANPAYVSEALRHGAIGYVLKGADAEELIRAVREAVKGQRYLSPPLSESDMENYRLEAREGVLDPYDMLTNREKEVLQLSAEGHTVGQIADKLHIGVRTAETHRANMLRKLDLHSQTGLVRYAIQRGIISAE